MHCNAHAAQTWWLIGDGALFDPLTLGVEIPLRLLHQIETGRIGQVVGGAVEVLA